MALFDSYMFVDWTARSTPSPTRESADSVWVAEAPCKPGERSVMYLRTRAVAADHVSARLRSLVRDGRRVLVGFDFPYSFPAGTAWAIGNSFPNSPWCTIWRSLDEHFDFVADRANRHNVQQIATWINSRCRRTGPGPAWFCSKRYENAWLKPTKAGIKFPFTTDHGMNLEEFRITERAARRENKNVRSIWQLGGRGSVGSQAIAGIAYLSKIRSDPVLAPVSRVWPFETGFGIAGSDIPGPSVIHAEIWPSLVPVAHRKCEDPIPDARQVCDMASWGSILDQNGALEALFSRPAGLNDRQVEQCLQEEGWILGAGGTVG
ncbi:MAG: hypothetical protein HY678_11385 [Chloroflexi bacterium]|nr:hypothetical protein [Chloroflexota bacterium]